MQVTVQVVLSAVAAVVALALAVGVARTPDRTGARALVAFNVGVAVWTGGNALQHAAVTLPGKLLWVNVQYAGIAVVPVAWVAFAATYTGRGGVVTRRRVALLSLPMVVLAALSWTNPGAVVRGAVNLSTTDPVLLEREFGPAFWLGWLYSSTLNLVATVLLVGHVLRRGRPYRLQGAAVVVGSLVPLAAHLAYLGEYVAFEPEPFFAVTGAAFVLAITRYKLLDLSPVARNALVERTSDAMFVCDDRGRLVDCNPAAARFVGRDRDAIVGESVTDALRALPGIARACEHGGDSTRASPSGEAAAGEDDRITTTVDGERRHFGVRTSTLAGGETLVVCHDVTALVERERALERQNDRLEAVAGTLSHDLRNPLALATGHVELARETGDVEALDEAEAGLDRMAAIVDDVLALARTGEPEETAPQSLAAVAHRAWATVDAGDVTLDVRADPTVDADAGLLQQLLENLFRNAVEHADPGVVVVGALADGAGFYVADDGRGIPQDVADSLFERGTTTASEGTGFGLAIVARIARAHDWTVDVVESERGGARFDVETDP